MSLEIVHNTIGKCVNDFKNNERHYLALDYSESKARLEFIDKLFNSPGRDVNQEQETNRLVYELYGLTEEEIKIVEGE